MRINHKIIFSLILILVIGCKKDSETPHAPDPIGPAEEDVYFPSLDSDDWSAITPDSLDWNITALDSLYDFLEASDSRAFIILKNGKIVVEKYWGLDILNVAPFDQSKVWYWASAAKTLKAVLVGKAQEDGLLDIEDKSSDYLGENWTSMTLEQENEIRIKHQLTMTTGMDYVVPDQNCIEPECLTYKEDPGLQWYYHNATYKLLKEVLESATGSSLNDYTATTVGEKIGMNGYWLYNESNNLYLSTARGAARFGLLLSEDCKWDQTEVLSDIDYINNMKNSSQSINPSYGYLTWLNGKESIILPALPLSFNVPLANNAPTDLYAALGKNGQVIDVVPSEGLVVVRLGDSPDESLIPTTFHNVMWEKIMAVID